MPVVELVAHQVLRREDLEIEVLSQWPSFEEHPDQKATRQD